MPWSFIVNMQGKRHLCNNYVSGLRNVSVKATAQGALLALATCAAQEVRHVRGHFGENFASRSREAKFSHV